MGEKVTTGRRFGKSAQMIQELTDELTRLRAALSAKDTECGKMRGALVKIAEKRHPDRSCSLEAQGYDRCECERIVAEDHLASIARAALEASR